LADGELEVGQRKPVASSVPVPLSLAQSSSMKERWWMGRSRWLRTGG
jgi:hypothetical protein